MKLILFAYFSLVWIGISQAQSNLFISNGKDELAAPPFREFGPNVYYVTKRVDTTLQGLIVGSYFFNSVDKKSVHLNKTTLICRDTAKSPFGWGTVGRVAYSFNSDTKTFSFFFDTQSDSSSFEVSPVRKYPKRINYLVVDTGLNVLVPSKPIFYDDRSDRYRLEGVYSALAVEGNRTVLTYLVCDTFFISPGPAAKLLIVDDTGAILSDKFLVWEPEGSGTTFPSHECISGLKPLNDGNYAVLGFFFDSLFYGVPFSLLNLDSNFDLRYVTDYPAFYKGTSSNPLTSTSGKSNVYFGGDGETFFTLPTGGFVRSSAASYKDDTTGEFYSSNGIGKTEGPTNCMPNHIYISPNSDSSDKQHSSMFAIDNAVYNVSDNRMYIFSSTRSQPTFYCIDGVSNFGQVVALDTNLQEKWVKYIRPRPGYCIRSSTVVSPDNRGGVLISGWEFDMNDRMNPKSEKPFIYHVDSSTRLAADDLNAPLFITDQFSVYPNPMRDRVTIENVLGTSFSYCLINAMGQSVLHGNLAGVKSSIDLSTQTPGLYLLNLFEGSRKVNSFRLLKQ